MPLSGQRSGHGRAGRRNVATMAREKSSLEGGIVMYETKEAPIRGRLLAGLGGAALGVALGILIAPSEGKESRRKLMEWLKEKRLKGRDKFQQRKDQVEAALDAGRKAYREAGHNIHVGA